MADFVKICPQCGQVNPEYQNICSQCQQFIAMEPSIPRPKAPATSPPQTVPAVAPPPSPVAQKPAQKPKKPIVLYLEMLPNGQVHTIYPGNIVGQAHPTSTAQVQLSPELPGVPYIHRQHLRFDYQQEKWWVTPLDQSLFQQVFTNPTTVNQQFIPPGQTHPLHPQDELQLSGVRFRIRILE